MTNVKREPPAKAYLIAVVALALAVLIAAIAYIIFAVQDVGIPEALVAIGSGSVGALGGLLTPAQRRTKERAAPPLAYTITVAALGLVMLVAAIAYIVLALNSPDVAIPDALVALGSGALGALAGLLTPPSEG